MPFDHYCGGASRRGSSSPLPVPPSSSASASSVPREGGAGRGSFASRGGFGARGTRPSLQADGTSSSPRLAGNDEEDMDVAPPPAGVVDSHHQPIPPPLQTADEAVRPLDDLAPLPPPVRSPVTASDASVTDERGTVSVQQQDANPAPGEKTNEEPATSPATGGSPSRREAAAVPAPFGGFRSSGIGTEAAAARTASHVTAWQQRPATKANSRSNAPAPSAFKSAFASRFKRPPTNSDGATGGEHNTTRSTTAASPSPPVCTFRSAFSGGGVPAGDAAAAPRAAAFSTKQPANAFRSTLRNGWSPVAAAEAAPASTFKSVFGRGLAPPPPPSDGSPGGSASSARAAPQPVALKQTQPFGTSLGNAPAAPSAFKSAFATISTEQSVPAALQQPFSFRSAFAGGPSAAGAPGQPPAAVAGKQPGALLGHTRTATAAGQSPPTTAAMTKQPISGLRSAFSSHEAVVTAAGPATGRTSPDTTSARSAMHDSSVGDDDPGASAMMPARCPTTACTAPGNAQFMNYCLDCAQRLGITDNVPARSAGSVASGTATAAAETDGDAAATATEGNRAAQAAAVSAASVRRDARETACVICLEGEPSSMLLCCGVSVHVYCVSRWAQRKRSCPACRAKLSTGPSDGLGHHHGAPAPASGFSMYARSGFGQEMQGGGGRDVEDLQTEADLLREMNALLQEQLDALHVNDEESEEEDDEEFDEMDGTTDDTSDGGWSTDFSVDEEEEEEDDDDGMCPSCHQRQYARHCASGMCAPCCRLQRYGCIRHGHDGW